MNVLLTGATGAVGPCVVQALCKAGHTVHTFSLDRPHSGRQTTEDGRQRTDARRRTGEDGQQPEDGGWTPLRELAWAKRFGGAWSRYGGADDKRRTDDVEMRLGDVTDPAAVQSAMQGMDAVVYLAALLHVVNPPPELREIISAISSALGRKPPQFSIPVGPVCIVAGIIEDAMRLIGRYSPISRATIDKYTEDIAVEGQRIQNELGFMPQYDLDAGWRETVREMRKAGEFWGAEK